ncbi:MAG: EAL domain-containing protein [Pseudobutyrivibrio sp.]|nr:EAL domain-containing protein [Pseudobutyrivibrio sp.]
MEGTEPSRKNYDDLTGLLDKETFYDWAQALIEKKDEDVEYVVIFFDMDNFKLFNANYGYEKGDELLIKISEIIKENFSESLVARFSGDHFVVFTQPMQIINSITEVRSRVKSIQNNINIELKAGVCIVDDSNLDIIRYTDRARMACISIKKKYDTDYKFYDEELAGSLIRKQFIIDSLDEAIANNYIKVYYQPIVRSLTGDVCGWEALVRWIDPEKGIIYPNEFISVLEEYRLIQRLDCHVIEEVVKTFAKLKEEHKKEAVPVSINLSRIDLESIDIVPFIDSVIEKYHAPRGMFRFEITESILTDNPKFIQKQIERFRQSGYMIWMDDFGSGYSSLNVLKQFDFDLVKIDMEFLRDFDTSANGKIILKHMVSMLKNLGYHTLIEGVENKEQYDYMRHLGCELIQGYLIGRPMPIEDGVEELRNNKQYFERYDEREFYNEIGKVDLLKQNPFDEIEDSLIDKSYPLGIGIVKDGIWEFAYANDAYIQGIKVFGHETISILEDMINDNEWPWLQREQFWEICNLSKSTYEVEGIEYVSNNKIINMKVRHVANDRNTGYDAYLVSILSRTNRLMESYDDKTSIVSNYMFSLFECVDLFGFDGEYYENLYLSNSRVQVKAEGLSPRQMIDKIAEERVKPEDRSVFLTFMDLSTAKERLYSEKNGIKQAFFRILNASGEYVWKSIILQIVDLFDKDVLLSCVSEASREICQHMNEFYEKIPQDIFKTVADINKRKEYAFENIIRLVPAGVFWKDKERRFLGANQMFLDYYGLKSVDSIIGKTDEDMGWHINPEPFMNDELQVINEGKIIRNVKGECIIKGQVRKIMATKQPFIVDGEIVGLIGFFNDITDSEAEKENLENLSMTDELTGLLNRRALEDIITKYVSQYDQDKTDFMMMLVDVDRFKKINDMYGHDFGDMVLKNVSDAIKAITANNSVAFRIGGDEFVLLHQFRKLSEVDSIKEELAIKVSDIDRIDGMKVKVRISSGVSLYSESEDKNMLLQAADKRMYEDKRRHKDNHVS